jgi:hypothetical protein
MGTSPFEQLQRDLEQEYPDRGWLPPLAVLNIAGVADSLQLQRGTNLTRAQLDYMFDKFEHLALKPELEIVNLYADKLPRPDGRGRPPRIFKLGPSGAGLLRLNGHPESHACELKQDTPILHALSMLDLHLAAQQAGLEIQTDRNLAFGQNRELRPDHIVTLPDGTRALFEIEQKMTSDLFRRQVESLRHHADFFRSQTAQSYSPAVRMLISLPASKEWEHTLARWRYALHAVFENKPRPFELYAMRLSEFLQQPDWGTTFADPRWVKLEPQAKVIAPAPASKKNSPPDRAPQALIQRTARQDRLIMESLWQDFVQNLRALRPDLPQPDPEFFAVMRVIHVASHDDGLPSRYQASLPQASIYLLRRYLQMKPDLHERLARQLKGGAVRNWNVTLILHRMQCVIDAFLSYHGWAGRGPLRAYSDVPFDSQESHAFSVVVQIRDGELLMRPEDQIVPNQDEVDRHSKSLAWVLWALFAYADYLDLPRPAFW